MKKKYIISVVCALLGFGNILLGTISYYAGSNAGEVIAKTNKFSFDIHHNNKQVETINLYDTMETTDRTGKYIIPGDKGQIEIVILGTGSEVNLKYELKLSGTGIPTNMKFYLDEDKTEINADDYIIEDSMNYGSTMTKTHTIYWEWPYAGEANDDYEYQGKTFTINLTATGMQTIN